MNAQPHTRKYQLCLVGLLGVIVGLMISKVSTQPAQADNQHVYAQYQSPNDSIFQSVGNKPPITGEQMALFQSIFDLINQYTAIVDNPTACSVAVIMSIEDNTSSPQDAIKILENALQSTTSDKVRRAIRMKLMELYKKSGQTAQTQEMIRQLIMQ